MKVKQNRGIPFILLSLIVVGLIPSCVSQSDYETCRQAFDCGNSLRNIGYPFYGGNRPSRCGYPGYELNCQDGVPLLNISSILYRVVGYDNRNRTVRVARNDLWDDICGASLANITLNTSLFSYYTPPNDRNITLMYGCTGQSPTPAPAAMINQFNCSGGDTNGQGYFFTSVPDDVGSICSTGTSVSVRVNQTAAEALAAAIAGYSRNTSYSRNASYSSALNLLRSSLQTGFSIQWSVDGSNCINCVESGGSCGFDQTNSAFLCYLRTVLSDSGELSHWQKNRIVIITGGSVGISFLVMLSLIAYYYWRKSRLHLESNQNVESFLLDYGSLAPKRYSYNDIKKMTKSFKDKLGQGGYGIVYKGELPDSQLVAVKVLTEIHENAEDFINEVASISRTSHVNIVNLLGFCYDKKKRALVYEYMPNKSLDKFIGSTDAECSLELDLLYEIALGVARGLDYLHRGCNTRIVHFDIKPQNILLDEDFCPKISDFGLAKLFKQKQSKLSVLGARGTIGYIAPEVFSRNFGPISHKSDVYSYGMMLLEMGEARKIVETETIQSSENYFPERIYEYILLKSRKVADFVMEEKEETVRKMLMVGIWCIQTAPLDRPSMSKVVEMLEGSVQSIQIPPKPVFPSLKLSGSAQFSSSLDIDIEKSTLATG